MFVDTVSRCLQSAHQVSNFELKPIQAKEEGGGGIVFYQVSAQYLTEYELCSHIKSQSRYEECYTWSVILINILQKHFSSLM